MKQHFILFGLLTIVGVLVITVVGLLAATFRAASKSEPEDNRIIVTATTITLASSNLEKFLKLIQHIFYIIQ